MTCVFFYVNKNVDRDGDRDGEGDENRDTKNEHFSY